MGEQGGAASDSPPKQLSSKVWEKIVALLKVKGTEWKVQSRSFLEVQTWTVIRLCSFPLLQAVHLTPVHSEGGGTGGEATFDGKPLVTSAGVMTVPDLPDGAGIH